MSNEQVPDWSDFLQSRPNTTLSIPLLPVAPIDSHQPYEASRADYYAPDSPETALSPVSDSHPPLSSPLAASSSGNGETSGSGRATKRKRSRVTPAQLTQLERAFAKDRSPTATRRKEISEALGMQERQTQIWFQNRRAKAKLLEQRARSSRFASSHDRSGSPPETPPMSNADTDLQAILHEVEPISIIPCTDLCIGTWRRITADLHDLVAYACETRRTLVWFIRSVGNGFKMEIPYESVSTTEFVDEVSPGQGRATLLLTQPPSFFREVPSTRSGAAPSDKMWQACEDWTEGQEATRHLRHEIVGAAMPLAQALKMLPGGLLTPATSPVFTAGDSASSSPISIQPPSLFNQSIMPTIPEALSTRRHLGHGRQRSQSHPASPIPMWDFGAHRLNTPMSADADSALGTGRFSFQQQQHLRRADYPSFSDFDMLPTPSSAVATPPTGRLVAPAHHSHSTSLGDGSTVPIARVYSGSSSTSSNAHAQNQFGDMSPFHNVSDWNPSSFDHHMSLSRPLTETSPAAEGNQQIFDQHSPIENIDVDFDGRYTGPPQHLVPTGLSYPVPQLQALRPSSAERDGASSSRGITPQTSYENALRAAYADSPQGPSESNSF